jgi:prevent-host-death family protein
MSFIQEAGMARTVTAAQAKSGLAECIRKAESGEAVIITRHGKRVAVLVAADRMASIAGGRGPRGGGLAALAGGWKGSEDFVRTLAKLRRSQARRIVRPDS